MSKKLTFKEPAEDVVKEVSSLFPIKLGKSYNIIDSIHEKYPFISKTEIALIVKTFFEAFREVVFSGGEVGFSGLFSHAKMTVNAANSIKMQVSTPRSIRKNGLK
jgi:nucleoid DNA-binding protein